MKNNHLTLFSFFTLFCGLAINSSVVLASSPDYYYGPEEDYAYSCNLQLSEQIFSDSQEKRSFKKVATQIEILKKDFKQYASPTAEVFTDDSLDWKETGWGDDGKPQYLNGHLISLNLHLAEDGSVQSQLFVRVVKKGKDNSVISADSETTAPFQSKEAIVETASFYHNDASNNGISLTLKVSCKRTL